MRAPASRTVVVIAALCGALGGHLLCRLIDLTVLAAVRL